MTDIDGLLPHATPRQAHILQVLRDCGMNMQAASDQTKLSYQLIVNTITAVRRQKAANDG